MVLLQWPQNASSRSCFCERTESHYVLLACLTKPNVHGYCVRVCIYVFCFFSCEMIGVMAATDAEEIDIASD